MGKIISGKENRTEEKQSRHLPCGFKYVFAIAQIVSMVLLFAASVFFVAAILLPAYIRNVMFGVFSGLSDDDFLLLMSAGAFASVTLLVLEGIYMVRLIVKRSLSRYMGCGGNTGK